MASRAYETAVEDANRNLWLMWAGALVAVPLFGAWGFFISAEEVPMSLPLWYQISIGMATLLMGGMAIAVPKKMLSNRVIMEHVRGRALRESQPTGRGSITQTGRLSAAQTGRLSQAQPSREERLTSLIAVYQRPFVIGLALSEMVALLGVVYVLLSAERIPMLVLLTLSAGLLAFNRPAFDTLTARAIKYLPEDRPAPTAWPTQQSEF